MHIVNPWSMRSSGHSNLVDVQLPHLLGFDNGLLQVNTPGRSCLVAAFRFTQAGGTGWKEVPEMKIVCVVSILYTFWDSQLLRALRLECWLICFC